MSLYHIKIGFPFVSENAELVAPIMPPARLLFGDIDPDRPEDIPASFIPRRTASLKVSNSRWLVSPMGAFPWQYSIHNVISYDYGQIEAEPSFPMTNFGDNRAYQAGARPGPRGVMGNAQTHCVQLPNIFAFARGAAGKPVSEADYVAFANDLISGKGQEIVGAWKALSGTDSSLMRAQAAVIRKAAAQKLETGRLAAFCSATRRAS